VVSFDFQLIAGLPVWTLAGTFVVVMLVIAALVWLTVLRTAFRRRLLRVVEEPDKANQLIHRKLRRSTLALRSGLIEKIARNRDPRIVELTGVDRLWIERVRKRGRRRDIRRVLDLAPNKGLFACFAAALRKRAAAKLFLEWLESTQDMFALRRIALSEPGAEFAGGAALELLRDRLGQIREMTGDPEWPPRYFAIRILLHSGDERSLRAVWEAFKDPNRNIRRIAARFIETEERERLYESLYDLYLHDPVYEVRRTARRRLARGFPDRYQVDPDELTETEAMHALGLLEPESVEDKALAFTYLESENLELALPAALHLQRIGALGRLFRDASTGDPNSFRRAERLLTTAAEVNVTGFLEEVHTVTDRGPLLLAARILATAGDQAIISVLARRVFALTFDQPRDEDVYYATVQAVSVRGDDRAFDVLRQELGKRRADRHVAGLLLSSVPGRAQHVVQDTVMELLRDPVFEARDELHECIARFEDRRFLPEIIAILQGSPNSCPRAARTSAVQVLSELRLPYARQYLLENLAMLEPDEARELSTSLARSAGTEFSDRAWEILNGRDGDTRAALIAVLPALGAKEFLKPLREAVKDADPTVRIAAIWALLESGDTKSFNQAVDRLRDPVEHVRTAAATALAAHGSDTTVQKVREVLEDENEVEDVKGAVIEGLGRSGQKAAIAVLIDMLEQSDQWDEKVIEALSRKRTGNQVAELVQHVKDGGSRLREKLMRVFRSMGTEGETAMVELLEKDIGALRPFITEILEETGYVEATIRKMAHRDPAVRREAAEALGAVGTLPAFRGIVLAARDPDPDVRVRVTRALEKLESDAGKEILKGLQNDPDRRVRKFTLWAMERYRAKEL